MAAGTNWKRPWEDVDFHSGCSKIDNVNNEALLSGFPDTLLDRSHGSQRRVSSPVSRAATPAVLSPSPYRHVGPFNKVSETPRDLYGPHPPALHLRKRQRTDEFQGHGRDSMTVLSAQGESDEPSLRPQGIGNLRDPEGEHPEMQNNPDRAAFATGYKPNGADQAVELSNQLSRIPQTTTAQARCDCHNITDFLQRIVVGLVELHADMSSVITSDVFEHLTIPDLDRSVQVPDTSQDGLQQSLEWVFDTMHSTQRMAKHLVIFHSRLPNYAHPLPHDDNARNTPALNDRVKRKWDYRPDRGVSDIIQGFPRDETEPQSLGMSNTPTMSGDERRRSIFQEFTAAQTPLSPHRTSSSSVSAVLPPQSPLQAPPSSRLLPSPSSLNFSSTSNVLPPISPSLLMAQSPHTAHLQDLQHQISTKSLALQILQREHDKLLAAFQRSQTRCATLDKKFQVSDAEINGLAEERIKLQEKLEFFESQVEELQQSREEAHKQSVANGAQYMQIMAMSSKLQAQGAADLKKWKAERDEWCQEKEELTSKLAVLQRDQGVRSRQGATTHPGAGGTSSTVRNTISDDGSSNQVPVRDDTGDVINQSSLDVLRGEVKRLRGHCQNLETALLDLRMESEHIDDVIQTLGGIGKRMRVQGPSSETIGESTRGREEDAARK